MENVNNFLNRIDLNYKCEMRPLFASADVTGVYGGTHNTDFYGTFDPTNERTYGCFKENYTPVNPEEIVSGLFSLLPKFPLVEDAFIQNYNNHKGKRYNGGEKYTISLKLNDDKIDYDTRSRLNQDYISNYLVIGNSHGGGALRLGFMTYTASCANQFGSLKHAYRHSRSVLSILTDGIEKALNSLEEFKQEVKILNEFEMSNNEIDTAIRKIQNNFFDGYADKFDDHIYGREQHQFSTRTQNNVHALSTCIEKEMADKGRTGWGLLSGITNFTTHSGNGANKDYTKLDGSRSKRDNFAKDVILDLANGI